MRFNNIINIMDQKTYHNIKIYMNKEAIFIVYCIWYDKCIVIRIILYFFVLKFNIKFKQ